MSDTNDTTLTATDRATLAALLDELLPGGNDDKLPAAGDIGLVDHVEQTLTQIPAVAPVITQGLAKAAELGDFTSVTKEKRTQLVKQIESDDPTFVLTLMFLAYSGYYQHERVIAALGMEARAPHPQGYAMEPNDLTLLDGVRRRPKMWRE